MSEHAGYDIQQWAAEELKPVDREDFWNGRLLAEFDVGSPCFGIFIRVSRTDVSHFTDLRQKLIQHVQTDLGDDREPV